MSTTEELLQRRYRVLGRGSRYESGAGTARMCGPNPSGGGNTVLICATAVVLP